MAKRCFPLSIVNWAIVKKSGRKGQFVDSGPSEKWWRGFKKRHQAAITLRTPDNRGRGRMANQTVIDRQF